MLVLLAKKFIKYANPGVETVFKNVHKNQLIKIDLFEPKNRHRLDIGGQTYPADTYLQVI